MTDKLKKDARQPFLCVFLDGRNEHGSHVLTVAGESIDIPICLEAIISDLQNQDIGLSEQIISEAEALGHEINHCVTTLWVADGERGDVWFEYAAISPELTELFFGTPEEQTAEFLELEAKKQAQ